MAAPPVAELTPLLITTRRSSSPLPPAPPTPSQTPAVQPAIVGQPTTSAVQPVIVTQPTNRPRLR